MGLGTDSVASNNDFNLWKEMDFAAKLGKLTGADNAAMTAADSLKIATSLGAQALGFSKSGQNPRRLLGRFPNFKFKCGQHLAFVQRGQRTCLFHNRVVKWKKFLCQGKLLYDRGVHTTLDREKNYSRSAGLHRHTFLRPKLPSISPVNQIVY